MGAALSKEDKTEAVLATAVRFLSPGAAISNETVLAAESASLLNTSRSLPSPNVRTRSKTGDGDGLHDFRIQRPSPSTVRPKNNRKQADEVIEPTTKTIEGNQQVTRSSAKSSTRTTRSLGNKLPSTVESQRAKKKQTTRKSGHRESSTAQQYDPRQESELTAAKPSQAQPKRRGRPPKGSNVNVVIEVDDPPDKDDGRGLDHGPNEDAEQEDERSSYRKSSTPVEQESEHAVSETESQDNLFGRKINLRGLYRSIKAVGVSYSQGSKTTRDFEILTEVGEEIYRECETMGSSYEAKPRTRDDIKKALVEVNDVLDDLQNNIASMNFKTKELVQDVYTTIVPCLTRVLCHSTNYHNTIIHRGQRDTDLFVSSLRRITRIMKIILDIKQKLHSVTYRPRDMGVIKPVKGIFVKLEPIYKGFQRELDIYDSQQEAARRKEKGLRVQQLEEAIRVQREQEQAVKDARRRRWIALHTARLLAEPDARRYGHLAAPEWPIEPANHYDIDANGEPFDRIEVFPTKSDKRSSPNWWRMMDDQGWSEEEKEALIFGLARYSSKNRSEVAVFAKIFKDSCGRGKSLRGRTATEITYMAWLLKNLFISDDTERGLEIEQWVRDIPVIID
ncbi:hypothetical protein M501DRAFT_995642 [Patellaria atrata CBS 101060]|uniref:Uncharacterized protein n=1 Tax=Patellaria atrata CBS 101060 TaxID=1346257 RepID=A0A9P4VRL2_9PEZI|nr:hypothetical protein M501DRAFT_995642 [Patellaria atrata CBS 101060]